MLALAQPVTDDAITVLSDHGIKCEKKKNHCISSGSVKITHRGYVITANKLVASFINAQNSHYKFDNIMLEQKVNISSTGGLQGKAQHAIYDLLHNVITLKGSPFIQDGKFTIYTDNSFVLNRSDNTINTKGKVVIKNKDILIKTNHAKANLRTINNKTFFHKINLYGNLIISSADEIINAEKGLYDHKSQTIILQNNVQITKSTGILKGESAVYNLVTNQCKIINNRTMDKRVRTTIIRKQK